MLISYGYLSGGWSKMPTRIYHTRSIVLIKYNFHIAHPIVTIGSFSMIDFTLACNELFLNSYLWLAGDFKKEILYLFNKKMQFFWVVWITHCQFDEIFLNKRYLIPHLFLYGGVWKSSWTILILNFQGCVSFSVTLH